MMIWIAIGVLGLMAAASSSGGSSSSSRVLEAARASKPNPEGAAYEAPSQVREVQTLIAGPGDGYLAAALAYWPAIKALDAEIRRLGGKGLVLLPPKRWETPWDEDIRYWMLHGMLLGVDWYKSGVIGDVDIYGRKSFRVGQSGINLEAYGLETGRDSRAFESRGGETRYLQGHESALLYPSTPIPERVVLAQMREDARSGLGKPVRVFADGNFHGVIPFADGRPVGAIPVRYTDVDGKLNNRPIASTENVRWTSRGPGYPMRSFSEAVKDFRPWTSGSFPPLGGGSYWLQTHLTFED